MIQTVLLDRKGLTLVEVLIAMTVLLLVSLAMMQTALLGIDSNMRNVLRDEAVSIAEQRIAALRSLDFTDPLLGAIVDFDEGFTQRGVRNVPMNFDVRRTIAAIGTDNIEITITIRWEWKENTVANGNPYTHTVSTVKRR